VERKNKEIKQKIRRGRAGEEKQEEHRKIPRLTKHVQGVTACHCSKTTQTEHDST